LFRVFVSTSRNAEFSRFVADAPEPYGVRPLSAASGRETGLQSLQHVAGSRQCTVCPAHAVTAQALPFSNGRRGSSSYVLAGHPVLAASLQVWNGMMVLLGAALGLDPRRNASERPTLRGASALSARGSCDSGNDMMLLYHLPPSGVCEPSPSKGVERRGGVPPSAELAAAGRWSYGNERCVGGLATVLLHSCVRPPSAGFEPECVQLGAALVTLAAADG
jgi:hypothetical protein